MDYFIQIAKKQIEVQQLEKKKEDAAAQGQDTKALDEQIGAGKQEINEDVASNSRASALEIAGAYAQGAVEGAARGVKDVVVGTGKAVKEVGLEVADTVNDVAVITTGEELYHGDLSNLGKASTDPNFSYTQHIAETGANVVTAGVYGEAKTLYQLSTGQIDVDTASEQLGAAGISQLAAAKMMQAMRPQAPATPDVPEPAASGTPATPAPKALPAAPEPAVKGLLPGDVESTPPPLVRTPSGAIPLPAGDPVPPPLVRTPSGAIPLPAGEAPVPGPAPAPEVEPTPTDWNSSGSNRYGDQPYHGTNQPPAATPVPEAASPVAANKTPAPGDPSFNGPVPKDEAAAADNAASQSPWKMAPVLRGEAIEKQLGQNLPQNFDVIDKINNGVATSIKSMDLGVKTYLKPDNIARVGRGYIDDVAGFQGASRAGVTVKASDIQGRALELAVPKGASAAQQKALQGLVDYGKQKGVTVTIKEIQ